MDKRTKIITTAMGGDAQFSGRVISAMGRPELAQIAPIVSFCMGGYLSLFVYEGYARLAELTPQVTGPLSPLAQSVAARSRHSLKFFEDNRRGVEGQISYFENEIFPAHAQRFFGNTWLPWARRWETDLGLYRYDGKLITTTHTATFGLGLDPKAMFDEGAGQELLRIMTEYGQYFAGLGATIDRNTTSFMDHVDVSAFGKLGDDVRSERYYRARFNGTTTPSINALLIVFQTCMNFVDTILPAGGPRDSLEYSTFKIRFLTIYQVLRSLEILRTQRAAELTAESMAVIAEILDTTEARMIIDPSAKPFRNTLMHYGPDSRIDLSLVDEDDLVGSLIPLCYSGQHATQFASLVDDCIAQTAAGLNTWAEN